MADCCLTGHTKEETLQFHVAWLSDWATNLSKKLITLANLMNAMQCVDDPEAKRLLIASSHNVLQLTDPHDNTPDDPMGIRRLMVQFARAKEMLKHEIPVLPEPKEEPLEISQPVEHKEGALDKSNLCMITTGPGCAGIPEVDITGKGASIDHVFEVQSHVMKMLLDQQNEYTLDDIGNSIKETFGITANVTTAPSKAGSNGEYMVCVNITDDPGTSDPAPGCIITKGK